MNNKRLFFTQLQGIKMASNYVLVESIGSLKMTTRYSWLWEVLIKKTLVISPVSCRTARAKRRPRPNSEYKVSVHHGTVR